jgi:hypothetical protein
VQSAPDTASDRDEAGLRNSFGIAGLDGYRAYAKAFGESRFCLATRYDLAVALQFRRKRLLAKASDFVIDPPLVFRFLDLFFCRSRISSGLDHATDRAVESSRPHSYFALRILLDLFHDCVAVALSCGEREENMEHSRSQRCVWFAGCHASKLYP